MPRKFYPVDRVCEHCGNPFVTDKSHIRPGHARFCSLSCKAKAMPAFRAIDVPEATKIRANGLINMRVRRGSIKRPEACTKCGKPGKVDGHHDDYSKPGEVQWLCRSCHMKRHVELQKMQAPTPA